MDDDEFAVNLCNKPHHVLRGFYIKTLHLLRGMSVVVFTVFTYRACATSKVV